ncbi:hypothetical protein LI82_11855 [Methanococcoides methylutens]|uniref:Polysaccharide pyruvyl transferase domain-containing protein n=1 Tax=Methanococcoides methylutens TaxID=2226 RepID=A0A099SZR9_METMT|nr:polysaccharide pyruvyl transferase family protein [Methanococcoides methylutens]KGK98392.1 hypothetical protein LI82_11855 [Methanococcoides methylutens]
MYIVLTGAKKNIGDFLITERCSQLLKHHKPEHELIQLPHWKSLEEHIDLVNESSGIIINGGPGFQPHFYPGIYKLMPNLKDIKVPIIPMGLGWKGIPGDYLTLKNYSFNQQSLNALSRISNEVEFISCRDYLTKEALKRNGINNVLMTGCPVWYDLDSIGKNIERPKEIKKLVFTPAQDHIYRIQNVKILKMLKNLFPDSELYCSFHRGIEADEFTSKADEKNNMAIKREADELGYNVVDTSYNLDKIQFYDDCDLHVGYRVHAHLYFLSKRKTSILLHEDGRGRGVSESLNVRGIDAFERTSVGYIADRLNVPKVSEALKTMFENIRPNSYAIEMLEDYITEELTTNFARFAGVDKVIDAHYDVMKKFIKSLP